MIDAPKMSSNRQVKLSQAKLLPKPGNKSPELRPPTRPEDDLKQHLDDIMDVFLQECSTAASRHEEIVSTLSVAASRHEEIVSTLMQQQQQFMSWHLGCPP